MMQWELILALAIVGAFAPAIQPCVAEASAQASETRLSLSQNLPESVVVDVFLADVPDQAHIGAYKQVSEDLFIRQLTDVGVYFSLKFMPPKTSSEKEEEVVERWRFRGYDCGQLENGEPKGLCSAFVTAELESDREQKHQLPKDDLTQVPHVITRQSRATGRKLQFAIPIIANPPTFTTQTAYYGCNYFGGGGSWCCAESNQNAGGPYCWSLTTCTEDYSAWNQQNIICCTASAGDCFLTYQAAMPTPAPTRQTPVVTTSAPSPKKTARLHKLRSHQP